MLISKTFDSSVICPAEQTCVIDDAIYDAVVAEFQRMGARLLDEREVQALQRLRVRPRRSRRVRRAGPVVREPGRSLPASHAADAAKVLLAPAARPTSTLWRSQPLLHEKLMPVLGLVRSPSVEHAIAACELVTEHGGLGHTSAVYATDEQVIERFARADPHRAHPRQRPDRGRARSAASTTR